MRRLPYTETLRCGFSAGALQKQKNSTGPAHKGAGLLCLRRFRARGPRAGMRRALPLQAARRQNRASGPRAGMRAGRGIDRGRRPVPAKAVRGRAPGFEQKQLHRKDKIQHTHPGVLNLFFCFFFPIFSLTSPKNRSIMLNMYHNGLLCLFGQKCSAFVVQHAQNMGRGRAVLRGFCGLSFLLPVCLSSAAKKFCRVFRRGGAPGGKTRGPREPGIKITAANVSFKEWS